MRPARVRRRGRMKRGIMLALPSLRAQRTYVVISGRCGASNPESRDSPVRNCAPEDWSFGPPRNDSEKKAARAALGGQVEAARALERGGGEPALFSRCQRGDI